MLRAILFDMGGTLDSDGLHWLDRFAAVYADVGVNVSRDALRAAFDAAEARSSRDEAMATADLDAMVTRHVGWQLDHLAISDPRLATDIVERFVQPIRAMAQANASVLSALRSRGFRLGVVSNGCGNVDVLCRDLGYAPFLAAIVDSQRVRLYKPDSAIYGHAADCLRIPPSAIMMVGDSFERDIQPAKSVGMQTAWLEGPFDRACPAPALVDLRLRSLADLPGALDRTAQSVA